MSRLHPMLVWLFILPGTAYTVRPCSAACFAVMRDQVESALRYAAERGRTIFNSEIPDHDLDKYCHLGQEETKFMNRAYDAFAMSPRAYKRTLKVARTIADLDASDDIKTEHIAEALGYRLQE